MTIELSKILFLTDSDAKLRVFLEAIDKDTYVKVSIKEEDDNYAPIFAKTLKKEEGTHQSLDALLAGLSENKNYTLKVSALPLGGTAIDSAELAFKTKENFASRYKAHIKTVFEELTQEASPYKVMINDMQNQVDKFSFDDFERAQIMAEFMAKITASMTQEASRTAITLAEKENISAKNADVLNKQLEKMQEEIILEQAQTKSVEDSVQHNLLIKLLGGQENYSLAMAGNSIIPHANMHKNYYMGVKEGYRWAGFSYNENGELVGTDGTILGAFSTDSIAT